MCTFKITTGEYRHAKGTFRDVAKIKRLRERGWRGEVRKYIPFHW
jgi:hypothetical protein